MSVEYPWLSNMLNSRKDPATGLVPIELARTTPDGFGLGREIVDVTLSWAHGGRCVAVLTYVPRRNQVTSPDSKPEGGWLASVRLTFGSRSTMIKDLVETRGLRQGFVRSKLEPAALHASTTRPARTNPARRSAAIERRYARIAANADMPVRVAASTAARP